ncbi:MAG: ABC transporter permease [Pseudomonadota bacterium]
MKKIEWGHYFSWSILLIYALIAILTQTNYLANQWDTSLGRSYRAPCWSSDIDRLSTQEKNLVTPFTLDKISPDDPLAPALRQIASQAGSTKSSTISASTLTTRCAFFGFDRWGRDILAKTLQGTRTSIIVGIGGSLLAITLGTIMGALAGFYGGGKLDSYLNGIYNIFTSVPNLLLIMAIAALMQQRGLIPMVLILGLTGWTGVFRLLRAEYLKHRTRDYVIAATLLGASPSRLIIKHILPNTKHLIGVQAAILTISFIKSEVILSFLGLGVGVEEVSWGTMLSEAQNELLIGFPWQLIAATLAMSCLSVALSRLSDDYTDPYTITR